MSQRQTNTQTATKEIFQVKANYFLREEAKIRLRMPRQ